MGRGKLRGANRFPYAGVFSRVGLLRFAAVELLGWRGDAQLMIGAPLGVRDRT